MNPLISRLSALAFETETTKGTAETLAAADGVLNAYDVEFSEGTSYITRQQQGTANKLAGVAGPMIATCSFRTHLVGNGATSVAAWTELLPACGYAISGGTATRTLVTSSQTTLTIGHYKNGIKQILAGAMGTFRIVCRNGAPADILWTFTGKLSEEGDDTILDPTEPTVIPPRGYETFSIDSTAIGGPEVTIDAGCQVVLLEDKNDTSNTGYSHAVVSDFNSTLTCEPYAELNSVKNWRSKFATSVENTLSLVVGDAANNIITIAASKLQLNAPPQFGDRVGVRTRQLNFDINDGFTIAFT